MTTSKKRAPDTLNTLYCYVDAGGSSAPIICGKLTISDGVGTWVYGRTYLARDDAFPLDPINLPLIKGPQFTEANKGVFGVLQDAGPDAWGQKLMSHMHTTTPKNTVELLVAGSGQGVGCLLFSASRSKTKKRPVISDLASLSDIEEVIQKIESGELVENKKIQLLFQTPSLGGACPKTTTLHNGQEWIAKFKRPSDLIDIPRVEAAVAQMAIDANIEMSPSELMVLGNHHTAFLTKRFDVENSGERLHFMSLHALVNVRSVRADGQNSPYRYAKIAEIIRKICTDVDRDLKKAYRLIAFNVCVSNTDDHARNYAFIRSGDGKVYFSPAYDLVPQPGNTKEMALSFDGGDRAKTFDNLANLGKHFNMDKAAALEVISSILTVTRQWTSYMDNYGVSKGDQKFLKDCFAERVKLTPQDTPRASAPEFEQGEARAFDYTGSSPVSPHDADDGSLHGQKSASSNHCPNDTKGCTP